jgi:membrane protease YdiL (CAAX protease family)
MTAAGSKRAAWFEIVAVLLLTCAPAITTLGSSLFWGSNTPRAARAAERRQRTETRTATSYDSGLFTSITSHLRYVPILLFVMWRSCEGWSRFGLVRPRFRKDVLIGLVVWVAVAGVHSLVALANRRTDAGISFVPYALPAARFCLLLADCCTIGCAEELWSRAYLIPRIEAVTGATWFAVVVSVAAFAFVHSYQGYEGILLAALSAAVWAIAFCLTRRFWPLALSHAIHDFIVKSHSAATIAG